MSVVFVLLPVALALAACAVGAFVWSVRRGQMDDLETPAMRAVFDDDDEAPSGAVEQREG